MPLWGIVLLGLAAWVLISVVLGVVIGRAVKVADTHRNDQEFVRRLSRRPPVRTPTDDAWPPRDSSAPAASAARSVAGEVRGTAPVSTR